MCFKLPSVVVSYGSNRKRTHTDFISKPKEKHDLLNRGQVGRPEIPLPPLCPDLLTLELLGQADPERASTAGFSQSVPCSSTGAAPGNLGTLSLLRKSQINLQTHRPNLRCDRQRACCLCQGSFCSLLCFSHFLIVLYVLYIFLPATTWIIASQNLTESDLQAPRLPSFLPSSRKPR